MDATKNVDKTNMSLDDIIKMDRKNFRKPSFIKNNFMKNIVNRAKNNANNKPSTSSFNRSRLGISGKRNSIKANIIISKRNNLNQRINTLSKVNERQNIPATVSTKSFRRNDLLRSAPVIRITAPNDQHQTLKRNNAERRPFSRNINNSGVNYEKSSASKYFPVNNRSTNSSIRNQRSYNHDNDSIRLKNSSSSYNQDYRSTQMPRGNVYPRKPFNSDYRHSIPLSNNSKNFISSKENLRRSDNQNSRDKQVPYQSKYSEHGYRRTERDTFERKPDRSRDREYEAMARALIEAHRDSRTKYQSKYSNDREFTYRR